MNRARCIRANVFPVLNEIPGWSFHGGEVDASLFSSPTDFLVDINGNHALKLDSSNSELTHNRVYVPADTEFLKFSTWIQEPSGNDQLAACLVVPGVTLGDQGNCGDGEVQLQSLTLTEETNGFVTQFAPIPEAAWGKTGLVSLRLVTPGLVNVFVDSEVWIDDVDFAQGFRFEYFSMLETDEAEFVVAYELAKDRDEPFTIGVFESSDAMFDVQGDALQWSFQVSPAGISGNSSVSVIDDAGNEISSSGVLDQGRHRLKVSPSLAAFDLLTNPLRSDVMSQGVGNQILLASTANSTTDVFEDKRDSTTFVSPGLDRWWATVDVDDTIDVTWTTFIPAEGDYEIDVDVDGFFSGWDFSSGTVAIQQVGRHSYGARDIGFTGGAGLGTLETGLYQFAYHGVEVPDDPTVTEIKFQLSGPHDAELKTFFVADHQEVENASYTVAGAGSLSAAQLVSLFAPLISLDSSAERFFPSSVESLYGEVPTDSVRKTMLRTGDATSEIDLSAFATMNLPQSDARVYASVLESTDRSEIAINYLFLYPRSDWGEQSGYNTHEGDTEGVTVFLKRSGSSYVPDRVAFAQHTQILAGLVDDGGETVYWPQLQTSSDGFHPVVYVSLGAHASYFDTGTESAYIPSPIIPQRYDEFHRGFGSFLSPAAQYVPRLGERPAIDDSNPFTLNDWLLFPGQWGRSDIGGLLTFGDTGPQGFVFQSLGFWRRKTLARPMGLVGWIQSHRHSAAVARRGRSRRS